jgi:hypothetical protein
LLVTISSIVNTSKDISTTAHGPWLTGHGRVLSELVLLISIPTPFDHLPAKTGEGEP